MKTLNLNPSKSFRGGWELESIEKFNGYDWKICTMKRSNGKLQTTAQAGELLPNGGFTFGMFTSPSITLISEKKRATENTVKEQHVKALAEFDRLKESGELPENKAKTDGPKIGTILFLDGYGETKGTKGNNRIVYEIEQTEWGTKYLTVEKDTLELEREDTPKPFSEKFGIGIYFEPDFNFEGSQDDLNNLVIEAKQKKKQEQQREESEQILKAQARQGKIEEGKKLINIPDWAKCVIVADNYQNDSDSMTDYFSTSVSQRIFLAFSRNDRNNMQELRKAALNFEHTKDFPERADNNTDNKYEEVTEYNSGHSYLPNYFLGTEQWFGFKVTKLKYFDLTKKENREEIYIAAANGLCFIPNEEEKTTITESTNEDLNIELVEYSDKAIAVIGETKPLKDTLKSLGGRFNFRLKCGAGWIFPKAKTEEVKAALNL
jgi:hypothetical protein